MISRREADEMLKKQMQGIAEGKSILIESNEKDKKFLSSLDFELNEDVAQSRREDGLTMSRVEKRKEYRCLNTSERNQFHTALNFLKNTKEDGYSLSIYDRIVLSHNSDMAPGAHGGPAFSPWHRHYLYL